MTLEKTPDPFSPYSHFYLVGIKGVAMTSIAQMLLDLGKKVSGSDVPESFVTQKILDSNQISIDTNFETPMPKSVDCVIYTAAHEGADNPQVLAATQAAIPTLSQAEALAKFFNAQRGIAVCGVGGKSTVSAMLTWIFSKLGKQPSFSVGVGSILGLEKTGSWNPLSDYCIAEADEYVTNPQEVKKGGAPIPRFSYLQPFCTICTNLMYDHPDVYASFDETKKAFTEFFSAIKPGGTLILNHKDLPLLAKHSAETVVTFGSVGECDYLFVYDEEASHSGITKATLITNQERYELTLAVPGRYNVENAVAALAACDALGIDLNSAIEALASFSSTQRRFEAKGTKNGVIYYDDYAHHPSELSAVISALTHWYPNHKLYVAFQPHTFSRTKTLLPEFVSALATAPNLILLDIFASARENLDPTVSSQSIADGVTKETQKVIPVLASYQDLATYLSKNTEPKSIVLTVGAGDIYKVHDLI